MVAWGLWSSVAKGHTCKCSDAAYGQMSACYLSSHVAEGQMLPMVTHMLLMVGY